MALMVLKLVHSPENNFDGYNTTYLTQQESFAKFYRNLPEKPASTVRFFNHGDFYSVHDDDTAIAAEFLSTTIKVMSEESKLSYVTLSTNNFEKFVRELLIVRQYRVEVYVKPSSNKNNDWYVEYKGSPGNLSQFEGILFDGGAIDLNNSIMGIKIVKKQVLAISCINITEAKFELCELTDNECFSELEALLAQISPAECIIPTGEIPELIALKNVLERNGILVAKMKKSEFISEDIVQDLNRLLFFHEGQERNAQILPETSMTEALSSLQALIKFLNLTGDERNFNQFKISIMDTHKYVRLDNAALSALNVLPKLSIGAIENYKEGSSRSFSLIGILDSCRTNQGKRLLEQWIKQPLRDYNLINERLDIVECFARDTETRQILSGDCLTRVPDLLLLAKKLISKKASLEDCYKVYQIIGSVPYLVQTLKRPNNKSIKAMLTDPISEILTDLEKYQSMIEQILDLDLVDRGEFFVKRTFDEELNELYNKKEALEEKMQKTLSKVANDLEIEEGKALKLELTEQCGYVYRVTLKEEPALRKNKTYTNVGVVKSGVRFTSDKLTELNEKYSQLKEAYEQQQANVVKETFEVAASYADTLRSLNIYIAMVDVFISFATASVTAHVPYVRPRIHKENTGILKMKKVRHPCLERQDSMTFIPNDVEFSKDDKTLHIITGPNMCGKSTYIRSVGLAVLMAHIGCLVPCEEADISMVDAILARVGADDCQLKGLSTFMLEMLETSSIIKSGTENSLIIVDELGRGTSTYDGCGIAWAITEYLAETKCFSLFATHFHEISQLAEMIPCINNLHVSAMTTNNIITPLYRIKEGECDKSYGIHCARMVAFPEDVIKDAERQQKQLEYNTGTSIENHENSPEREVIYKGDEIVKNILENLQSLYENKMSDEAVQQQIRKLKTELESSDNLFIKGLISN